MFTKLLSADFLIGNYLSVCSGIDSFNLTRTINHFFKKKL